MKPTFYMQKAFYVFLLTLFICLGSYAQAQKNYTDYVNLYIGTKQSPRTLHEVKSNLSHGGGNTTVGPRMPWGFASVNPRNAFDPYKWEKWDAFSSMESGYMYGAPYSYGFSHFNINGVGCGAGGHVLTVPSSGFLFSEIHMNKSAYSNEIAKPGYYSQYLDFYKTKVEATSTERTTLLKMTYDRKDIANIRVDLFHSQVKAIDAQITKLTETQMEGWVYGGSFCGGASREKIFFSIEIDRPADEIGYIKGKNKTEVEESSPYQVKHSMRWAHGQELSGYWRFNVEEGDEVLMKTGISLISTENARLNLNEEQPGWDFEGVRSAHQSAWESELSKIKVEGGTDDQKTIFYTALYHSLIHPNVTEDVNGEYLTIENKQVSKLDENQKNRYSLFSLWDTFRSVHPLLTLVYPDRQLNMIRTMVDHAKEHGELTFWEITANETYVMDGEPAHQVILDTYKKGLTDFDAEAALDAMLTKTRVGDEEPKSYELDSYLELGYIPIENYYDGATSTSLEYYYSDWCVAELGKELGRVDVYKEYMKRAKNYKLNYDEETGHMRPRYANGEWFKNFNPDTLYSHVGPFFNGGPGFLEANAWHYGFYVPHDMEGLIKLMGKDWFFEKLELSFASPYRFIMYNQPAMPFPFLYNYVKGEEWRTQKRARETMDYYYLNEPGGIPGNDDAGTLSAWYVFAAMGFYPDCPGSTKYQIASPIFDKITIELDPEHYPGKQFIIEAKDNSEQNMYIQDISLNGKNYSDYQLDHKDIVKGGKVVLEMSSEPDDQK